MTKREYLRSLGFTVGERGRFTDLMKAELAKYDGVFDDDVEVTKQTNISKIRGTQRSTPSPQVRQREARSLYGYTKEGYKVGFVNCARCHQHMIWCNCEKVTAPKIVVRSDDKLVRIA